MNYIQRDNEIFKSIKDGKITELVCIKEGYTDPQKGDSFRPDREKEVYRKILTLNESYGINNFFHIISTNSNVFLNTNFNFDIDIINGSGVSLYFETPEVYKAMKRNDKLIELGI